MADLTVITYGGAEMLKNVFNGVAMLFNGKTDNIIQPIMMVSASLAGVYTVSKAFLNSSVEILFTRFFLPLLTIPYLLLVPTCTVKIEDVIKDKSYTVDHVPFLLAQVAEVTSTIGYKITKGVENVMHTPNDLTYNKTGMVFGGETSLDFSKFRLTNATLEKNLARFSHQCVMYDLALGLYSINDLKKTTDLWGFLKSKTSKVRLIRYVDFDGKAAGKNSRYLNCQEALTEMAPLFTKEKNYFAKQELFKNLPLTFQALTSLKKTNEDLISQQLMMSVLSDEFSPQKFASLRAVSQQRNNYQALGSFASDLVLYTRVVFEALIYASFFFISILAPLPGGIRFVGTWLFLTVWIQMWPPMYAIVNYIMLSVAPTSANAIMNGLGDQCGLSIFTSAGLQDLHTNISALAGYLLAIIPPLTYAILQGGTHAFSHIASSMMSPAHSAASSAAIEQSSGNISLSNVSYGQMSHQNTSSLQTNTAPNLSSGFFTDNQGTQSTIYGGNEAILNQGSSNLIDSMSVDRVVGENLQKAHQTAETQMAASQTNFTQSISHHSREMTDLTEHLAKSSSFSEGISEREAVDVQNSARFVLNQAESFGAQFGLSERQSAEALVSTSVSSGPGLCAIVPFLPSISGDARYSNGTSAISDEALNAAKNIVSSEDFQTNFQKIQDFAKSTSTSSLTDEGARYVEGFSRSLDEVRTSQEQLSNSLTQMNQISENLSWSENNSQSFRKNLNQDFINWAVEKYSHEGGFSKVEEVLRSGNSAEKEVLYSEFSQRYLPSGFSMDFVPPQEAFERGSVPIISKEIERASIHTAATDDLSSYGLQASSTNLTSFADNLNRGMEEVEQKFNTTQEKLSRSLNEIQSEISEKGQLSHASRLWGTVSEGLDAFQPSPNGPYAKLMGTATPDPSRPSLFERLTGSGKKTEHFAGKYQNVEQPFWANLDHQE